MKIPQDIDRLLWSVAEQHDPRAFDEFAERYPAYKDELVARTKLVRSLRGARPNRDVPVFNLPQAHRAQSRARMFQVFALGALVVVAAASVGVTVFRHQATSSRQTPPVSSPASQQHGSMLPHSNQLPPETVGPKRVGQSAPVTPHPVQPAQAPDPFGRLVTVDEEGAALSQVLRDIAHQAGIHLEFAPGMSEETVNVRYMALPAKLAFEDLGQNFGISVVVQEGSRALVIPAIDSSRPVVTLPDGSYSEPAEPATGSSDQARTPGLNHTDGRH